MQAGLHVLKPPAMRTHEVIRFFGGATATAKALGITHQAVYAWGDRVPASRAYQIQVVTNGRLRVRQ